MYVDITNYYRVGGICKWNQSKEKGMLCLFERQSALNKGLKGSNR